jgi:hypothetical protein
MLRIDQNHTRRRNQKVFVSNLLKREYAGLEDVEEGLRSVCFGPVHLGWLGEQDCRTIDVIGERRRP